MILRLRKNTEQVFTRFFTRSARKARQVIVGMENSKVRGQRALELEKNRIKACKLFYLNAEKRTRTSTPLRELEPESSASANSAISAADFKSMFLDCLSQ